jgi:uncharacterized membrane protein YesL
MALFEQTSFFVTMLIASFNDIFYFMVLLGICILGFANAITVVEHNMMKRFNFLNKDPVAEYATFIDVKDNTIW